MNIKTFLAITFAAAIPAGGAGAVSYLATIDAAYFEGGGGAFLTFNNTSSFDISDLQLLSVGGAYAGESVDLGPVAAGDLSLALFGGPFFTAFAGDYDDDGVLYDTHGQPIGTVYQYSAAYGGQTFLSHRFSPSQNATGGYVDFLGLKHDQDFDAILVSTLRIRPGVAGAVPEPAAWTLMLLGFGAVGGVARRRRPASTLPLDPAPGQSRGATV